ncbi:MAG: NYN domain-containing protein [Elusimicrobia bacterium]|nr:NYN domain-containing protein [Elusimicrobiota bacterium]
MRTYLVDGSNAVRGDGFDPRFPAVEDERAREWLARIDSLAAALPGIRVEVFFDGPRREMGGAFHALGVRFPVEGGADEMILGSARMLASSGRSAVVVTKDGSLADEVRHEGARVMDFDEFESRLRRRKA